MQKINPWECPNHDGLFKESKVFQIEKYIERIRGILRKYLSEHKKDLLKESEKTGNHCYDPKKVMWWDQSYLEKA